jgi:voltage-gated potassium channel
VSGIGGRRDGCAGFPRSTTADPVTGPASHAWGRAGRTLTNVTETASPREAGTVRIGLLVAEVLVLVVAYFLIPLEGSPAFRLLCYVVGLGLVVLVVGRQMRRHLASRDDDIRVDSLALAIVLAVLLFALAYYALSTGRSGEFSGLTTRVDALYYSLTVATTTGFGDVSAESQLARVLVSAQLVFNMLIVATAVPLLTRTVKARRAAR